MCSPRSAAMKLSKVGSTPGCGRQVSAPVDPLPHELAIEQILFQEDRTIASRSAPSVPGDAGARDLPWTTSSTARGIDDDERGAGRLALDDALGVRIEVVARLEVGREQQNRPGVRVVWRRPVGAGPQKCPSRADDEQTFDGCCGRRCPMTGRTRFACRPPPGRPT